MSMLRLAVPCVAILLLLLAFDLRASSAADSCPAGDPKCAAGKEDAEKKDDGEAKEDGEKKEEEEDVSKVFYGFGVVSFLGMSYMIKNYLTARGRFKMIRQKAASAKLKNFDSTLSEYVAWRFSHWCSWTPGSQGIILASLSLCVLVLGGALGKLVAGQTMAASVWSAWAKLIAPDGGADGEHVGERAVGMVCSFAGLLVFALFVSMISDTFTDALEGLKTGRYKIVEEDHIVILGWNPAAPMLVEELCTAAEDCGGICIVVLCEQPKPEIEDVIRDDLDIKNAYIGVRQGKANVPDDLATVSITTARSVIVLTDPNACREEQDAKTLRILLALQAQEATAGRNVVVQCCLPTNKHILQEFGGKQTQVVVVDDYVGGLLVQCSRRTGIASIFGEVLGFDGDEIYIKKVAKATGRTFDDVLFCMQDATLLGVMVDDGDGKKTKMIPDGDYVIKDTDEMIYFSEDNKLPSVSPKPVFDAVACRQSYGSLPSERKIKANTKTEVIWMLGWNAMAGTLIAELDRMVGPESEVHIYSPSPIEEREEFLKADAEHRPNMQVKNLTIKHYEGKLGDSKTLFDLATELPFPGTEALEKQQAKGKKGIVSAIFVLAEQSYQEASSDEIRPATPEESDELTLSLLVLLQHMMLRMGLKTFPQIIPETRCKETDEMCLAAGTQDFISSQRIVSRVLSAICWTPELNTLFVNILEYNVAYFTIGPLTSYILDDPGWDKDTRAAKIKELFVGKEVSFFECQAVARNLGEIVIGWTKEGAVPEGFPWTQELRATQAKTQGLSQLKINGFEGIWEINPKDKFKKRKWIPRDRLLFISRDFVSV